MARELPGRVAGILEQRLGDEYVVVDPVSQIAYSLVGVPARVWAATAGLETDDTIVTGGARGLQSLDDISEAELESVLESLTIVGLLNVSRSRGVSRRSVLAGGSVLVAGGLVALALPSPADAASGGPSTPYTQGPSFGSEVSFTVGASATPRTINFTIYGAGGASGAALSSGGNGQGAGGNAGFSTGTITFPAGPQTTFTTNVGGTYQGAQNAGNAPSLTDRFQGIGGGATSITLVAGSPALVAGGGGGGASAGNIATGFQAGNGGNGSGITAGTAGVSTLGTDSTVVGGGASSAAGGTAGAVAVTAGSSAALAGSGPLPGGSGGDGGANGADTTGGGTGGGGYYGGGGGGVGGNNGSSTYAGGGGGGSGYASGLTAPGSVIVSGINVTVTAAGVTSGSYGLGGAAPTGTANPNYGQPGQAIFSTTGTFTFTTP